MTVPTIILIYLVGNATLNMCWIYMNASFMGEKRRFWELSGLFMLLPKHYLRPAWLIYGGRFVVLWFRLMFFL